MAGGGVPETREGGGRPRWGQAVARRRRSRKASAKATSVPPTRCSARLGPRHSAHGPLTLRGPTKPGEEVEYVFDLGDHRQHRCTVANAKVDALEEYGSVPSGPVAIFGWGIDSPPDQEARLRTGDGAP